MSKKILIVESDAAFSKKLKEELSKNSFEVVETTDGKGAYDLTRREKPDLVVLAVELAAGQSGYLVCGKIKKDDDLKKVPVIIIGKDPEGFEGHKKLKTRAEEYLKKPFAPEALTVKVGVLIGLPEAHVEEVVVEEEAIALDEPAADATHKGDAELDLLDDAFANMSNEPPSSTPADIVPEEPAHASLSGAAAEDDLALDGLGGDDALSLDALEVHEEPARTEPPRSSPPPKRPSSAPGHAAAAAAAAASDAELLSLRGTISELEEKISGLESQLTEKDSELAAARAASTKLAGMQSEVDHANEQLAAVQGELDALKGRSDALAREVEEARNSSRSEVESLRSGMESTKSELESLRSDHGALKSEHEQRVSAHDEEANQLRARIAELEDANSKNEDRVVKAYQKIKGDEKLKEKTRKAISVALQLLDDTAAANLIEEKDANA
jgi:DNA-binding response OmpR family regulator